MSTDVPLRRFAAIVSIHAAALALTACGLEPLEPRRVKPKQSETLPPIALDRPADERIRGRLAGILGQVNGLEAVDVSVREGVVHLGGSTETLAAEQYAVATAWRLEGVAHVSSSIEQPSSPWRPLASLAGAASRAGRTVVQIGPRLGAAVLVFVPFLLASILLRRWQRPPGRLGLSTLSLNVLQVALRVALLILGALLALHVLGLMGTVSAVVGALGILGLVAGLVFRDWVSNYLPGLMLGLQPPFRAGDLIQIGTHEGRVARIGPSSTVLVSSEGDEVRIPNAEFFRRTFVNFSHHNERRIRFTMMLATTADLFTVEELGCRAMREIPGIMAEPPPFMRTRDVHTEDVEVEFFAWVDQTAANYFAVQSRVKRRVLEALVAARIPRPETTIALRRPEGQDERFAERSDWARGNADAASEAAQASDGAFLDRQWAETSSAGAEPDLLKGGSRPNRSPRDSAAPPRAG